MSDLIQLHAIEHTHTISTTSSEQTTSKACSSIQASYKTILPPPVCPPAPPSYLYSPQDQSRMGKGEHIVLPQPQS